MKPSYTARIFYKILSLTLVASTVLSNVAHAQPFDQDNDIPSTQARAYAFTLALGGNLLARGARVGLNAIFPTNTVPLVTPLDARRLPVTSPSPTPQPILAVTAFNLPIYASPLPTPLPTPASRGVSSPSSGDTTDTDTGTIATKGTLAAGSHEELKNESRDAAFVQLTNGDLLQLNDFHGALREHTTREARAWWVEYLNDVADLSALIPQVTPDRPLALLPEHRMAPERWDIRPLLWDAALHYAQDPARTLEQQLRFHLLLAALVDRGYFPPFIPQPRLLGAILGNLERIMEDPEAKKLPASGHRFYVHAGLWYAYLIVKFDIALPDRTREETLDRVFDILSTGVREGNTRSLYVIMAHTIARQGYRPLTADGRMTDEAAMAYVEELYDTAQEPQSRDLAGTEARMVQEMMRDARRASEKKTDDEAGKGDAEGTVTDPSFKNVHVPFVGDDRIKDMLREVAEELAAHKQSTGDTTGDVPPPAAAAKPAAAPHGASSRALAASASSSMRALDAGTYGLVNVSGRGNNCFFNVLTEAGHPVTRAGVVDMLRGAEGRDDIRDMIADDVLRIAQDDDQDLENAPRIEVIRQMYLEAMARNIDNRVAIRVAARAPEVYREYINHFVAVHADGFAPQIDMPTVANERGVMGVIATVLGVNLGIYQGERGGLLTLRTQLNTPGADQIIRILQEELEEGSSLGHFTLIDVQNAGREDEDNRGDGDGPKLPNVGPSEKEPEPSATAKKAPATSGRGRGKLTEAQVNALAVDLRNPKFTYEQAVAKYKVGRKVIIRIAKKAGIQRILPPEKIVERRAAIVEALRKDPARRVADIAREFGTHAPVVSLIAKKEHLQRKTRERLTEQKKAAIITVLRKEALKDKKHRRTYDAIGVDHDVSTQTVCNVAEEIGLARPKKLTKEKREVVVAYLIKNANRQREKQKSNRNIAEKFDIGLSSLERIASKEGILRRSRMTSETKEKLITSLASKRQKPGASSTQASKGRAAKDRARPLTASSVTDTSASVGDKRVGADEVDVDFLVPRKRPMTAPSAAASGASRHHRVITSDSEDSDDADEDMEAHVSDSDDSSEDSDEATETE